MSKNYFFYHDKDARNDPKIKLLRVQYGKNGYSNFFMLLEILTDSKDYKLNKDSKANLMVLRSELEMTNEEVLEFLEFCITLELLTLEENGDFYSKRLSEHMVKTNNSNLARKEKMEKYHLEKTKKNTVEQMAEKGSSSAKMEKRFYQDDVIKPEKKFTVNHVETELPFRPELTFKELVNLNEEKSFNFDIGASFDFNADDCLGTFKPEHEEGKYYSVKSGCKVNTKTVPFIFRDYWTRDRWRESILQKKFFGKVDENKLNELRDEDPKPERFFAEKLFHVEQFRYSVKELLDCSDNPFQQKNKKEKVSCLALYKLGWQWDISIPSIELEKMCETVNSNLAGADFKISNLLKQVVAYLKQTNSPNKLEQKQIKLALDYFEDAVI